MEDLSTEFKELKHMQDEWGNAAHRIFSFIYEIKSTEKASIYTLKAIEKEIASIQKYPLTEPYMTQISGGLLRARELVNEFNAAIDKEQKRGQAGGSRRSAKRKGARKTHKSRKSRHKSRR
jgi:hypothetical protein